MDDIHQDSHAWTAQERLALVMRILRGEISIEQASRDYRMPGAEIESWRDEFLAKVEKTAGSSPPPEELVDLRKLAERRAAWICARSQEPLVPCLFMQAASGGEFPEPLWAGWLGVRDPPRSLRRTRSIPLLHAVSKAILPGVGCLHLLTKGAATSSAFERDTNLSEWELPIKPAGIVLLLEEHDWATPPSKLSTKLPHKEDPVLKWAKRQSLQLVVGCMGSIPDDIDEDFSSCSLRLLPGCSPCPGEASVQGQIKGSRADDDCRPAPPGLPGPSLWYRRYDLRPRVRAPNPNRPSKQSP